MSKSGKPGSAYTTTTAMTEHSQKVEEAEAAVMDLNGPQAKAALMLLAREFPREVLESLEYKGPWA